MKKMIFTAALVLASAAAMAQKSNFQVKVDLKNFATDSVIVFKGRDVKMDTILVKNGKFTYSDNLAKVSNRAFLTPKAYRGLERKMFNFPCVPGEKAEIKGDFATRFDVTGSKFYQQYHEVDLMMESAEKDLKEYSESLNARTKNGEDRETIMNEYEKKMPALLKARTEKILAFVKQNPDNEACATLFEKMDDYDQMKELLGLLSENVKNGRMKAYYQYFIDTAKKRAEADEKAKKLQASGIDAPDFTLNDINGKPFTFSSLRGKYVVIDFWGSWCGWCIKGMPKMKEYYAKYKVKLEILGIDCNDTEQKWRDAVKKHELPWLHVRNEGNPDVTVLYGISGFPTKIVVDAEGKISKVVVGESEDFYTYLDQLLGK